MNRSHGGYPLKTQVLIIGGGATGTGIARDLALRGVQCILAEYRDINAGASGANHGLLHSGGRYVFADQGSAKECREEGKLLKKLAPHCIEDTGGLFVAVEGDDERYVADFPLLCSQCNIPVEAVDACLLHAVVATRTVLSPVDNTELARGPNPRRSRLGMNVILHRHG